MPAQDALVIGLGYVGLPLAVQAARAGFRVTGFDTSAEIAAGVNAGRSHVDDVPAAEVVQARARGFRATSDEAEIGPQDVIVICVPTPLSAADGPDLGAVRTAAEAAGRLLRPGTLVSLESTTYPGTTDEVVRPLLEKTSGLTAGIDFSLVFSPERIDPGNPKYGLVNTPKIVGGVTPSCAGAAAAFYGQICGQVVRAASAREAEMAKLLENTYRHVNIALVNEMVIFCRELGIDLHDAIRCAATKPFGFQPFYPGPGVGGHCIPIDPNYLSYKVRTLGYPARPIARKLRGRGASVAYHDPHVPDWQVDGHGVPRASDLRAAVAAADLVILLQAHRDYDLEWIAATAPLLLDTRGVVPAGARAEAL